MVGLNFEKSENSNVAPQEMFLSIFLDQCKNDGLGKYRRHGLKNPGRKARTLIPIKGN
jgi:hypothetical protein